MFGSLEQNRNVHLVNQSLATIKQCQDDKDEEKQILKALLFAKPITVTILKKHQTKQ